MKKLRGIFAPIPTPFKEDESLDMEHLRANVRAWGKSKLAGLTVMGSNGEFAYQNRDEKVKVLAAVREDLPTDKMVIAGTGEETTQGTIALTKEAAKAGADFALVLTPHYYKGSMTEAALKRFFLDVAEASPLPVIIYNMPGNTGINLNPNWVVELSQHRNIVGIKDSSGIIVQIAEVASAVKPGFAVFAGSASFLLPTLAVGGVGGTLAAANVMPNLCAEVQGYFEKGDLEAALKAQRTLLPVNKAVTSQFGIAGLKAAVEMIGLFGGPTRRPMLPISDADREKLRGILDKAGAFNQSWTK